MHKPPTYVLNIWKNSSFSKDKVQNSSPFVELDQAVFLWKTIVSNMSSIQINSQYQNFCFANSLLKNMWFRSTPNLTNLFLQTFIIY